MKTSSFINFINGLHLRFLSEKVRQKGEHVVLTIAIISYIGHLLVIFGCQRNWIDIESSFMTNPIFAIYTPFSFILIYEVYLLIYYLPKSITIYIGKQYEIITLIVIRRIFKDISNLELTSNWFSNKYDLQFTYDSITALLLFILIYLFYKNSPTKKSNKTTDVSTLRVSVKRFVMLKRSIAVLLIPILFALGSITFINWTYAFVTSQETFDALFKNINAVFFDDFFSMLIIVDVLLLLASFFYSDRFHKIIRNSGFMISTILIKLSFSNEGLVNNMLIIGAILFGLSILLVHNLFEKNITNDKYAYHNE